MLSSKFRSILLRIMIPFANFPIRLLRLVFHLLYPFLFWIQDLAQYRIIKSWIDWLMMIPFYLIDLLGVCELYEIGNELINWKIRDINSHENLMIKELFPADIPIDLLRINPDNILAKQMSIAYVSFRQVNFNARISNDVFVHEIVHIWQYQLFGAVYIYFAWKAQISKEGYDYGRSPALIKGLKNGKLFLDFNFEQQAEIIQDYYREISFKNLTDEIDEESLSAFSSYHQEMINLA